MNDQEIQERLAILKALVEDVLQRYVGLPVSDKNTASAKSQIRDVLIRSDLIRTSGPALSDVFDPEITFDEHDPGVMVVRFKRKHGK